MAREKPGTDLIALIVADVYELAGAFRRAGERIARSIGQTQARWQVLSAASDLPKTVPQIARRLGVSRQNVQQIADGLVDRSLAHFAENPDHRNSPHLLLTSEGRVVLATLTRTARKQHQKLALMLRGIELEALRQKIGKVVTALDALSENRKDNAKED